MTYLIPKGLSSKTPLNYYRMKKSIFYSSLTLLLLTFGNIAAKSKLEVSVTNPSELNRSIETVEVSWSDIADKGLEAEKCIVLNDREEEIASQVVYNAQHEAEYLLFQTQLKAAESAQFTIRKGTPAEYPTQIFAKAEPKRYNDFAWENNVIAYRIYHTDLIPIDGPSSGIDVWSKRTQEMVIEKWFSHMNYHKDHGQGCDSYKVGPTLGAGGIALLENNHIKGFGNYTTVVIRANGPLRLIAEFSFEEQNINGQKVSMKKTLTYDAGKSLNKFDVVFNTELKELPVVTGITKRKGKGQLCMNEELGCIMYWEPKNAPNGHTGVGIVMPEASTMGTLENHIVAYGNAKPQKKFTYYSGACWDKGGIFTSAKAWKAHLQQHKEQLSLPLQVTVK